MDGSIVGGCTFFIRRKCAKKRPGESFDSLPLNPLYKRPGLPQPWTRIDRFGSWGLSGVLRAFGMLREQHQHVSGGAAGNPPCGLPFSGFTYLWDRRPHRGFIASL